MPPPPQPRGGQWRWRGEKGRRRDQGSCIDLSTSGIHGDVPFATTHALLRPKVEQIESNSLALLAARRSSCIQTEVRPITGWLEVRVLLAHHALFRTSTFPADYQMPGYWRAHWSAWWSPQRLISALRAFLDQLSLAMKFPFPAAASILRDWCSSETE